MVNSCGHYSYMQCLQEALEKRSIHLKQMTLLIFMTSTEPKDRTRTKNLIARHYCRLLVEQRPRILTIAVAHSHFLISSKSPVVRVHQCALLRLQTSKEPEQQPFSEPQPIVLTMFYEPQRRIFPTHLLQKLQTADPEKALLKKDFKDARLM